MALRLYLYFIPCLFLLTSALTARTSASSQLDTCVLNSVRSQQRALFLLQFQIYLDRHATDLCIASLEQADLGNFDKGLAPILSGVTQEPDRSQSSRRGLSLRLMANFPPSNYSRAKFVNPGISNDLNVWAIQQGLLILTNDVFSFC